VRQYDLCRNLGRAAARAPYLLVLQRDDLALLKTRLVAPVLRLDGEPVMANLFVPLVVEDESLHVSLPEIFSIDRNALGPVAGNHSALRDEVVRALDMLVTG
jgi:CcdB protein